ncbi:MULTISPECIES: helix-turn-helix domain-containing protein [Halobacteriales]|jgi:DNA-binding MarR family transcriptional regulator|uniref:helix-turn-helix domain-containing protein n=1 Tax=Halobacteriales TaxID=2235 RepID=UPI0010927E1A|nr:MULTISPECIES: helix-turn-helix domain-containing protein [Halobacteriales]MCD2203818.1 helix-turn-helix domain-containing protein [Halobacterium sp. KA-6]
MLTKAGLAVIDALSTGREATAADLAMETEYSQTHLYDVLDKLLESGLLAEHRGANNQREVSLTDHPVVEAYRALRSELGHVEWPDLLSPATLRVCWYLDEPRRVSEIAERLKITRQGAHKALSPLKHRSMLSPSGPEYALSEDLSPLLTFARAVVRHEHRSRVRRLAPSATVEWCDPKRALVRVQTAEDTEALEGATDWQLTGLARFAEYGLQFFLAGEPAFWYAPDMELTPADVVCHTLVLDSGSRRVSYAMLLIETSDIGQETLTRTSQWYGLESTVTAMYRSLQGEFDIAEDLPVVLPSEAEFRALKEQYGVA